VVIAGRVVCGSGAFVPPEERGVGMMFQDYALFPHLSVLDNVKFGLARVPAREADDRASAALERIGLVARANDYPHALSGGEQQRVALVRALLPAPRILLMDEPFSNLDKRTRDRIRDETTAILRESGTTAILVTHDPEDAIPDGPRTAPTPVRAAPPAMPRPAGPPTSIGRSTPHRSPDSEGWAGASLHVIGRTGCPVVKLSP
jgi:iron(III) transport system ATP-binding protein